MAKLNESLTFPHGATVTNRFVQPPMLTSSGDDGFATQNTIDYYAARSQAGGMIITEYMYVSENGGPALTWRKGNEQLAVYDDKFIPQLKKVAAAIKQHGNKAIMQIAHTGREANYRAMTGRPVYAPSAMDLPFLPYKIHELSDEQVRQIVEDFGAATKRAIEAGFDGVEIHGANHYLIQQFVSAYSNRRTDHWGGSLEKRFNFPLAVVKAVTDVAKKYAPDDFIIGYRISPEEIHGKNVGFTWHESTKLIDQITGQYDLDYIHLSMPNFAAKPGNPMLGDIDTADNEYADSDQPLAKLFQPFLNGAKEIIVGGINSKEKAEQAAELADLVAVGRENIIDPLFAQKILTGHEDEIVTTETAEQAKKAHMTDGLIQVFSAPEVPMKPFERDQSFIDLHQGFGGWNEMKYPDNSETK